MGSEGKMSYGKLLCVWVIIISSIASWFLFGGVQNFFPGVTRIGSFETSGIDTDVFDVKAGGRACLVFASKGFEGTTSPRFFFSCPQER